MKIKDIFEKDVSRAINGVIKVGDESAESVWQELDEYVVTKELRGHFDKFFTNYNQSISDSGNSHVRDRIGIWVSGFFGSGKSHFIKIISYLLRNIEITDPTTGKTKQPTDIFETKIEDLILLGDIKRAVQNPADVILFNIDSKAKDSSSRDALLRVFMDVLNELQGYSTAFPHLAEIERQLEKDGHYEEFKIAFEKNYGASWLKERDAYEYRLDATIEALTESTGMSKEAASKLLDDADKTYSLSVEKFARLVKEYLDQKDKNHRIIFVADEVGQFIGTDTHLMLNLQTIVEDLGKACDGRAWVIVTSQEEMDSVLGNVVGAKSNDFSKIQGRFPTRLSLSSSNTDEVIQARLLRKTAEATEKLRKLYSEKGDVIKNQLSFGETGATLKNFKDGDDFASNYPFAPYHYRIVQDVFESIRKAGATGLHLARGERSMLDAFQMGAMSISDEEIGKLVPFYSFYPSVESFLDTVVKKTIDQAAENPSLDEFDGNILKLLFLIRYVEVIKPTVENIVTLCITKVDDDRLGIKTQIEASLLKLEKQTLISRNGDLYFFLTNEERDIGREIKGVDISSDDVTRHLADSLFNQVLPEAAKHRYSENKKDFSFNRFSDGAAFQGNNENNLNLEVITPLNAEYKNYTPQKSVLSSSDKVLIKLADNEGLFSELQTYLQTQRYVQQKNDAAAPENTKRILRDKSLENQQRSQRIITLIEEMLADAEIYVAGKFLSEDKPVSIAEAQSYLIKNLFGKMSYLNAPAEDPQNEIEAVLSADDVGQKTLKLNSGIPNTNAIEEIRGYVDLRARNDMRITLDEIASQFEKQPFGWRDWDSALLVAKLFAAGEFSVKIESSTVKPQAAVEPFLKRGYWKNIQILKRRTTQTADLDKARNLAHEVFGKINSDSGEDELFAFITDEIKKRRETLLDYRRTADTGEYPGLARITKSLRLADEFLQISDSYTFFDEFNKRRDDWLDDLNDFADLEDFYKNQIDLWQKMLGRLNSSYNDNISLLNRNDASKRALTRLLEIKKAEHPYKLIREIEGLLKQIDDINEQILSSRREKTGQAIDERIKQLQSELDSVNADGDYKHNILRPFQLEKESVQNEKSIQKISYTETERLNDLFNDAIEKIEAKRNESPEVGDLSKVLPIKHLKVSAINTRLYIETEAEADEFVEALRDELKKLLSEKKRIRIQ